MIIFKVSTIILLVTLAVAEKKIELQDIEEDNLKSEKEKDNFNTLPRSQTSSAGLAPLEFLKSGLFKYFEPPPTAQQRFVQQYAVTEQPEDPPLSITPKPQYGTSETQQAMVGYLSNVPMQIYLVPQYYSRAQDQTSNSPINSPTKAIYPARVNPHVHTYLSPQEIVQPQASYVQGSAYIPPTVKTYVKQYSPAAPVLSYSSQPTVVPQTNTASVLSYQVPIAGYAAPVAGPSAKEYYQSSQYADNTLNGVRGHEEESPSTNNEVTYQKGPIEYSRFYPSRPPSRDEYRHSSILELPHPNPILLKGPSHVPKALPMYRPYSKPIFPHSAPIIPSAFSPRPSEAYGVPFRRRPTSLLDSYIPSHVQIDYMKRGLAKNPIEAYEALSSGRHLVHPQVAPRHYERGFLPNQMYHTAAGGIAFGHYKRTPKLDKSSQK